MKILVFNGSPKGERSNTMKLTTAFIKGMSQNISADVEILNVSKLKISECLGCFGCWNKTPGKCVINDDMSEVIQRLLDADVVIWSFPLYYFCLPSRLKMLMDRQLPMSLPFMNRGSDTGGHNYRYNMDGKRYVVISTCGFYTAKGNYDAVNAQFNKLYGKGGYETVFCGQGELFRVPELKQRTDEYLEYVKKAGAEFATGAISNKTKEQLSQLLFPRDVFEEMADASWGIDNSGTKPVERALVFTKQMAALYNKSAWNGKDVVLEFVYTDVGKTYQVLLGKDGHKVLMEDFLPYTTRIETPLKVWEQIGKGEIDGRQALMEHLYKVSGDFDIMLKWDEYFGVSGDIESEHGYETKKMTNMRVMLIPWITIWSLMSFSSMWGGIAGILVCGALPFAFIKYKPTMFEFITLFSVSAFSLLVVLGYPVNLIIPASYFVFGLMWTVTVFMRVPLSAWYSMNRYGEEEAFNNPLFMQTNRILTCCWGILYLVMPVWTIGLLKTSYGTVISIFNAILPALLGIFTVWFERLYPRHYAARG